ncbi:MAG: hypothetical protein E7074_03465 [Bacteroidales bacterium]|nr:hypothetical protein [Bacteroidales bacterium]
MMLFVPLFLCLSCTKPTKTICGVPVQGTPWELAAAIADHGDGTFLPECVLDVSATKAYINGAYFSKEYEGDFATTIICDVRDGQVYSAVIECEIEE